VRDASVGAEASGGQSWDVQSGRYKKSARLRYIRGLPRTPKQTTNTRPIIAMTGGLHVQRSVCLIFTKIHMCPHILVKTPNTEFHGNMSGRSCVPPCARTDGRTDITRLTVGFRNCFEKPPKSEQRRQHRRGTDLLHRKMRHKPEKKQ
jgi:hypothetical protein